MATTINSYSVSLALDASSYIKNSVLSRKESAALHRQINMGRSPIEKYERSLNQLDNALEKGAITQSTYNRLVQVAKKRLDDADRSTSRLSKSSSKLAATVKRVAGAYLGFQALKSVGTSIVSQAAEAEQTSVAFKVLIGDTEEATKALGELRRFAASTPFAFPEIAEAGRMLLAFNFSTEELGKELQILGNLAAGTNQPIGELAELVGKARVQTTIYSEDLNQFTGRGINVLDGLAKKFGVATSQVKKLASEGKISFNDLQGVLEQLATGTGKFNGLMQEQSETLNGQWSTLKDSVSAIAIGIGNELLPVLKMVTKETNAMAKALNSVQPDRTGFSGQGMLTGEEFLTATGAVQPNQSKSTSGPTSTGQSYALSRELGLMHLESGYAEKIGSGITAGFDSLSNGFQSSMAMLGAIQQQVGGAIVKTQLKGIEEQKESPAIKAMEVGTQEAYQFLTEQSRKQAQKEARQEKLAQVAAKNQEEIKGLMERLVEIAAENGFKRFR